MYLYMQRGRANQNTTHKNYNTLFSYPADSYTSSYRVDSTGTNTIPNTISSSCSSVTRSACQKITRGSAATILCCRPARLRRKLMPLHKQKMLGVFQGWQRLYYQGRSERTPLVLENLQKQATFIRPLRVEKMLLDRSYVSWANKVVVVHVSRVQAS